MDIVERLRKTEFAFEPPMRCLDLMDEAADEIARLRVENERLREALRNIADKTVCSYAKITATVALINWQEPTALQQNGSE
jgi:regulator of replication initiation timing